MKFKYVVCSLLFVQTVTLLGCVGKKDTLNKSSDALNSPLGYWATEDSVIGQVGLEIDNNKFRKCTIALGGKISEETGILKVDGVKVKYTPANKTEEYAATYHSDNNILTEDDGFKLKYIRADDEKIAELNKKGCHF